MSDYIYCNGTLINAESIASENNSLQHAKYTRKKFVNGKWVYYYDRPDQKRILANNTPVKAKVKKLNKSSHTNKVQTFTKLNKSSYANKVQTFTNKSVYAKKQKIGKKYIERLIRRSAKNR